MSIEVMNAVWRQSQATGRARLVLLAIADHQGEIGAWPSIATLARMVNASERSVQRDIQELVALGELDVQVQQAPSRGQYKSNLYWVTLPGVTELQSGVTNTTSGVTKTGVRGDTVGVLNLKEPLQKPNRTIVQNKFEPEFQEFWKIYPRRSGKAAAQKAFVKACQTVGPEVVLAGAVRFAKDPYLPTKQFIPHPATWLNQGRWDDEPLPERELTPEEKAAKAQERSERERAYAAEQARLRAEENERRRLELEANPVPHCEHGRIVYACRVCAPKYLEGKQ